MWWSPDTTARKSACWCFPRRRPRLPPDQLQAHVRAALQALRAEGAGSSQTPTRAIIQDEPPNADAGEITDKGYINQRAVLGRRSADVAALYNAAADPRVIRA